MEWSALSSLDTLRASGNALSGTLSAGVLCALSSLTWLDLSSNGFSGTIPSLGSCMSLSNLDLKSNALTGARAARVGGFASQPALTPARASAAQGASRTTLRMRCHAT